MTGFLFSDVCLIFRFPLEVLSSFLSVEAFTKPWVSHPYTVFNTIFLLPLSVLRSQISLHLCGSNNTRSFTPSL